MVYFAWTGVQRSVPARLACCVVLFAAVANSCLCSHSVAGESHSREQVVAAQEHLLSSVPLHVVAHYREWEAGVEGGRVGCEYWMSDDGNLVIVEIDGNRKAYGWNQDYGFILSASSDSDNWSIVEIGGKNAVVPLMHSHLSNALFFSYVEFQPLVLMLKSENHQWEIHNVDGDLSIELSCVAPIPGERYLAGGTVVLDPANSLAIKRFQMDIVSPVDAGHVSAECDYSAQHRLRNGVAIPHKRTLNYYTQDTGQLEPEVTIVTLIDQINEDAIVSDRFRLASFGLPEPAFAERSRVRVWGLVLGLVLLASLGVAFRRTPASS